MVHFKVQRGTQEPRENRAEIIKEQIRHLIALRDNYSNEIPAQILSGSGDYKVRRNWWQGFFDSMDYIITKFGVSDPSIKIETDELYDRFQDKLKKWRDALSAGDTKNDLHKTTKEEIDKANELLTRLIENLQNSI